MFRGAYWHPRKEIHAELARKLQLKRAAKYFEKSPLLERAIHGVRNLQLILHVVLVLQCLLSFFFISSCLYIINRVLIVLTLIIG